MTQRHAAAAIAVALAAPLASCGGGGDDLSKVPEVVLGHCVYINNFSDMEECREYLGDGWDEAGAREDCSDEEGSFEWGTACGYDITLGRCVMNAEEPDVYQIQIPGDDEERCSGSKRGCEFFGGGTWDPSEVCGGDPPDPGVLPEDAFNPGELVCVPPLEGEPPGQSENGEVCTREMISSCTEPGRKFVDYASCEPVYTQRPYYAADPAPFESDPEDPRLQDEEFMAELEWVTAQVEACACTCCHSSEVSAEGTGNWFIEAGPIWIDSMFETGMAMGAGWIDSTSFGAWPAEENNGFDREDSGFPTTDPERFKAFFAAELERRGYSEEDFADTYPFGGPLYSQLVYEPGACEGGEGVNDAGAVVWSGGPARYIYVLEADAANPGAPPNLDLPDGTVWRVDVPHTEMAVPSGFEYGSIPDTTSQRFPESGAPAALTSGRDYYLYVLADVGIPLTRCIFTAP